MGLFVGFFAEVFFKSTTASKERPDVGDSVGLPFGIFTNFEETPESRGKCEKKAPSALLRHHRYHQDTRREY